MPSKELLNDIATLLSDELPEGAHGFDYEDVAKKLCAGFLAALQEPNRPMSEIGQPYVRVGYDAWDVWRAMLNASPLGEQGE